MSIGLTEFMKVGMDYFSGNTISRKEFEAVNAENIDLKKKLITLGEQSAALAESLKQSEIEKKTLSELLDKANAEIEDIKIESLKLVSETEKKVDSEASKKAAEIAAQAGMKPVSMKQDEKPADCDEFIDKYNSITNPIERARYWKENKKKMFRN